MRNSIATESLERLTPREPATTPAIARWAPLVVALVTGITFLPALDAGFVNWDDDLNFVNNSAYRGLGWNNIRWMFTTFHAGPYQPLTWLSLALDYSVWRMNPFGYHLTSVALHVANSVLFYFVTLRLLGAGFDRSVSASGGQAGRLHHNSLESTGAPDSRQPVAIAYASMLGGLIFGIHPLRVESVAWVTERRDVLSGLFFLGTILAYLTFIDRVDRNAKQRWWYTAFALFVLSVLSKAITLTTPIVLVVLDIYPLNRLRLGSNQALDRCTLGELLREKWSLFVVSLAAAIIAFVGQAQAHGLVTLSSHGVIARLCQVVYGLAFYIRKTIVPTSLIPLYRFPDSFGPHSPSVLVSAMLVCLIGWFSWKFRSRLATFLAAVVAFVVLISPVLGIVQTGSQLVADRYSYLSCMPWAVLAAAGAAWCLMQPRGPRRGLRRKTPEPHPSPYPSHSPRGDYWGQRPGEGWPMNCEPNLPTRVAVITAVVAYCSTLGILTWKQCGIWHDSVRLWTHTLSVDPDLAVGHYNLGLAYDGIGEFDRALVHYRESVGLDPSSAQAHNNLASVLADRGELAEATMHFETALELDPNFAAAHFNLGNAFARLDRFSEAVREYETAITLQPELAVAHRNLGILLVNHGSYTESVAHFQRALRLDPDDALTHYTLGRSLVASSEISVAVNQLQRAVALDPTSVDARYMLGVALAAQQQYEESRQALKEARGLAPERTEPLIALAWLLATCPQIGIRDGATAVRWAEIAKAASGSGESPEVLDALAAAYAESGRFPDAVETAEHALQLAERTGRRTLADAIAQRLKHYEVGQPLRLQQLPIVP